MTIIYGIHNCDTVKKALKWLDKNNIDYTFHDLRKDGLDAQLLDRFFSMADSDQLINKRSTTYRGLDNAIKNNLTEDVAKQVAKEQVTLLKRPLLLHNEQLHLGFKDPLYQEIFNND
ncbi:Spx/MgsR family RNA polymerase-binding regulatory protein [Thalassotalea maritima]|uniref:Spx/MgsR family RNA polymerase-binding regulatory protein n=1 Tax=Thalassotalea maritima TaxID=3242416 RepID=UPI0035270829